MDKKGTDFKIIRGMILMLLMIVIVVMITRTIGQKGGKTIEDQECRNSIEAHIQMLEVTKGTYAPPITCPTKYETIETADAEKMKLIIAEDMIKAWNLWKKGEQEIFIEEDGIFCHIYKIYNFEEKNVNINNFQEYLILNKGKTIDQTYFEYIVPIKTNEITGMKEQIKQNPNSNNIKNFNTDEKVAIIFKMTKGNDKITQDVQKELNNHDAIVALNNGNIAQWFINTIGSGNVNILSKNHYEAYLVVKEYSENNMKDTGCEYLLVSNQ